MQEIVWIKQVPYTSPSTPEQRYSVHHRLPRTKTNPFRILAYSLFANTEWVRRSVDADVADIHLQTAPMRRQMRIPADRFKTYLTWLEKQGYIAKLDMGRGWAQFIVRHPTDWNWD